MMKKAVKQSTLTFLLNLASIIFIMLTFATFITTATFNVRITQLMQNSADLTENANRFMNGSAYLTNEVRAYASNLNQVHYDNYWNEINELKNREIGVKNMQSIGITAQEQTIIDEMLAISNKLVPLEEEAMAQAAKGNSIAAINAVYGTAYETEIDKINALKTQFLEIQSTRMQNSISECKVSINIFNAITFIGMIAVVLIQLISTKIIRNKIIKPIIKVQREMLKISAGDISSKIMLEPDTSEIGMLIHGMTSLQDTLMKYINHIEHTLSEMAHGNLGINIDLEYIGDFKTIQQSLLVILNSFNVTLSQIGEASDQVSLSSNQVSAGAQALSHGATEQANSVKELSSMITEISQQVKENAGNANSANQKMEVTSEEISISKEKMQQLIMAMNDITQSSQEIEKVIKTIEDIAFQTNILALNAAVEAARAGVAGKGFAVVADEVRNLASKSAEAAKNTNSLIKGAISSVQHGTQLVDDTAKALFAVVNLSTEVSNMVNQISKASAAQATSIIQVTLGVDQISGVVQTNSATAEESAAASEELSGQASMLKSLVEQFKLKDV